VMAAYGLPKDAPDEQAARRAAVQAATRYAIEVPLKVMEAALASMTVIAKMTEIGNPPSVSDAGVGALCARAAVRGAGLNVRINAAGLDDRAFVSQALGRADALEREAEEREREALALVARRM
jgi:glutamate formiminotransferase/formiminotetrahydrofolate cyclodeaminase